MKIIRNMFRHYKSNYFFTIFVFCFFLSTFSLTDKLSAMDSFRDPSEEELYNKGLHYRNTGNYDEAVNCLLPLAKKGYAKAQHNLATCYQSSGNELSTYHWLKHSSSQGIKESDYIIEKMNLLYLLLPNEMLIYIAKFCPMKDLQRFNITSERASQVVRTAITSTNYLTSDKPIANYLRSLFSQVHFEPLPQAIKFVCSAKTQKGSLAVHFRDVNHLRNIIEETPLIEADDKLYFVRDPNVEDGKEYIAMIGKLQRTYFIHVVANAPLKMTGQLALPYGMVVPQHSNWKQLNFKGKSIEDGQLASFQQAFDLTAAIESFDEKLYNIRTAEAHHLLKTRLELRRRRPDLFPDLEELCPEYTIVSNAAVDIVQTDYITADNPLIYIANSMQSLDTLQKNLPEFGESICYVDPVRPQPGVYCSGPLSLIRGFEIFTPGALCMAGSIKLLDHNLKIQSGASQCWLGMSISVSGSLEFSSGGSMDIIELYNRLSANKKPNGMPKKVWSRMMKCLIECECIYR